MTVQELITELQQVQDKTKPVFVEESDGWETRGLIALDRDDCVLLIARED